MSSKRVHLSDQLPEITPDIFTSGSAIVGIRGSGKTNDGVVLAEQAIAFGVPIVVVDPTGVWHGLKSSADGKSAGLAVYVFGGIHGDVPLEADAGAIIARFVVENRVSIVLDLSDLSKTKQRRFVGQFCEALYDLKARNREALLLIVDEAARFVPQSVRGNDIDLSKCIGAVEDIISLGRSRGLGCVIIGQRPASIAKNVLTQTENLFAMRTVGPQDRKAIDEWVSEAQGDQKQRDELVQQMPALKTGEGFFWSPALFGVFRRVKFAARTTFDSSRTPKVGEKRIEPKAFAKVDLDALRGEIASAIERAKADDPKALRRRIAELEAAMLVPKIAAAPERVEVKVPILDELLVLSLRQNIGETTQSLAKIAEALGSLRVDVDRNATLLERIVRAAAKHGIAPGDPAQGARPDASERRSEGCSNGKRLPATAAARTSPPALPRSQSSSLGSGERKILEAIASLHPRAASKIQVSLISGYAIKSSTLRIYLGKLVALGFVETSKGGFSLTDSGAIESPPKPKKTSKETVDFWISRVGSGPGKMLTILVDAYPNPVSKIHIADASGYSLTSSTFRIYLGTLRANALATIDGDYAKASADLFTTGPIR